MWLKFNDFAYYLNYQIINNINTKDNIKHNTLQSYTKLTTRRMIRDWGWRAWLSFILCMRKVQTYKVAVVDNFAPLDAVCSREAEKKKERGREKSHWKKGCEITHSTTHRLNILSILKRYCGSVGKHSNHFNASCK